MVVQTPALSDLLDTDKQCARRTSNCSECHCLLVCDVEIHFENAVPQHFYHKYASRQCGCTQSASFPHDLPHKYLPPCFVQGSLNGGSCVILVPLWPRQPGEFGSK